MLQTSKTHSIANVTRNARLSKLNRAPRERLSLTVARTHSWRVKVSDVLPGLDFGDRVRNTWAEYPEKPTGTHTHTHTPIYIIYVFSQQNKRCQSVKQVSDFREGRLLNAGPSSPGVCVCVCVCLCVCVCVCEVHLH